MFEFAKWLIKEALDPFKWFERLTAQMVRHFRLSKAMAFNAMFDLFALALVALYFLIASFRADLTPPLVALDRWLLGALLCGLFIVSERFWSK